MQIRFFEDCGRRGGLKRSRLLSPLQRSAISSKAAKTRWNKNKPKLLESVRLNHSALDDPVYLEELLSEGSLGDWEKLYRVLSEYPFGSVAQTLEKILASTSIYGVTPLWKGILRSLRHA